MQRKGILILIVLLLPITFLFYTPKPIPVSAAEEEHVDSFQIHPLQRWDYELTDGETILTEDSLLKINEDSSTGDQFVESRLLQDNDFKIETRFQAPTVTPGYTKLNDDTLNYEFSSLGNWASDYRGYDGHSGIPATKSNSNSTVSISSGSLLINGIDNTTATAGNQGVIPFYCNEKVLLTLYTQITVKIKGSNLNRSDYTFNWHLNSPASATRGINITSSYVETDLNTTTWVEWEGYDFRSMPSVQQRLTFIISTKDDLSYNWTNSENFQIDYIRLSNPKWLDYASMESGTPWDFNNTLGGWSASGGTNTLKAPQELIDSGWNYVLNREWNGVDTNLEVDRSDLQIDAERYTKLRVLCYYVKNVDGIKLQIFNDLAATVAISTEVDCTSTGIYTFTLNTTNWHDMETTICMKWSLLGNGEEISIGGIQLVQEKPAYISRSYIGVEDYENALTLESGYMEGAGVFFEMPDNTSDLQVYYSFEGDDSQFHSETFYNITEGSWYRLEISIDVLKSELDFKMKTDTGTTISNSDKSFLDVNDTILPTIFNAEELKVYFGDYFADNATLAWEIDYIKAPYHESRWYQDVASQGGRFESINEFGGVAISVGGDTNDREEYSIIVSHFDSFTGVMYWRTNHTVETNIDDGFCYSALSIHGIYANNGSVKEICFITLGSIAYDGDAGFDKTYADPRVRIGDYQAGAVIKGGPYDFLRDYGASFQQSVEAGFLVYRTSPENLTVQCSINGETFSHQYDMSGLSSEVQLVMEYEYHEDTSDPGQHLQFGIKDVQLQERAALKLLPKLPSLPGIVGAVVDFFFGPLKVLMRFLAISLTAGLGLIRNPLENIFDLLGDVADEIWTSFIGTIDDVVGAIITGLTNLVTDLVRFFEAVGGYIIENIIDPFLGGALPWFEIIIDAFKIQISWAQTIYDGLIEFSPLLYLILTAYIFLGATAQADNMIEYLTNLVDKMMKDVTSGISFLGFSVPIPLGIIWAILSIYFGLVI